MRKVIFASVSLIIVASCSLRSKDYEQVMKSSVLYSNITGRLTEVMTHDIFSPPVASRIYAYAHLAAFETMASADSNYISLQGQLKGFDGVPKPDTSKKISFPYASLMAFMEVGKTLTFSKDQTDRIIDSLKKLAKEHGMPEEMQKHSEEYGVNVAKAVMAWSKKDNYAQTRSAAKYTVPNEDGKWVPTPPAYISAIEPQWRTIRTIAMDSANQFPPPPHVPYSHEKGSEFYTNWIKQVCDTVNNLTEEQKAIASFWDCNGFKMQVVGHIMYATKAMTPGGHWMGIVGIICKDQNADFNKTVYAYTTVSFALMDAFISCWDAKYTWNLVRPETVINKYVDPEWKPFLQTPPFPEYTSGHSEISSASATVLEHIFGNNISFRDSTERAWGWPDRTFRSFREAAVEAGMSRFYGGIHYRPSVIAGIDQGVKVGNYVLTKLKMRKDAASQLAGK